MSDVVASLPSDRSDRSERVARWPQAVLLILANCLSVLGALLIAPVQPRMAEAFAGTPGVSVLVPLTVTAPALMVALLAPVAGRIADRTGRVRLLTISLVVYAIFGTAPTWLPSLQLVVVSRFGVGIAEAGIMTCGTTLVADLWSGPSRDRVLGLQTLAGSISAVFIIALGGLVGANGWRAPFWIYVVALLFAVAAPRMLWNPPGLTRAVLEPVRWRPLVAPIVMAVLGGIIFYTPVLQLSFALAAIGITSTATIGAISAGVAVATAVGAGLFGQVSRYGPQVLLPVSLTLAGVGLAVLGLGTTLPVVTAGAVVCSLGCGLLLPTLLVWALAPLPPGQRGRATGAWYTSAFIGQFVCPLLTLALGAVLGGLSGALVALGVFALLLAALGVRIARPAAAV